MASEKWRLIEVEEVHRNVADAFHPWERSRLYSLSSTNRRKLNFYGDPHVGEVSAFNKPWNTGYFKLIRRFCGINGSHQLFLSFLDEWTLPEKVSVFEHTFASTGLFESDWLRRKIYLPNTHCLTRITLLAQFLYSYVYLIPFFFY